MKMDDLGVPPMDWKAHFMGVTGWEFAQQRFISPAS